VSPVRRSTPEGRWLLAAAVLGSGLAALDATVVNVALPAIAEDLDTDIAGLQWILNGYLLTLASFLLLGGSLGDRYGRRRIFVIGVVWFASSSLLCGLAPSVEVLSLARALQGVGGALLTPGSLALLQAGFHPDDRAAAIGSWSGLGGVATAIGPFAGGWLVDAASWRWIFLLNLPIAGFTLLAARHVPESRDTTMPPGLDLAGAAAAAIGLGGVTWALIGAGSGASGVPLAAIIGIGSLVAFVVIQARSPHPLMPLELFANRWFTATNLVTLALYFALGGSFFLLVVHLQITLGYSPVEAGAALFPLTVIMLLLSSRSAALAQRIGPRIPMTVGPIVAGVGLLWLSQVAAGSSYPTDVLPALIVFGLGLTATVAPLTATVLASAEERHAGIASGVNNTVARTAGLLAIAALPGMAGIRADEFSDPVAFTEGFQTALTITGGLAIASGVLAFMLLTGRPVARHEGCPPAPNCPLDAPPLRVPEAAAV
jgi:EmrB/QacA subfamily drug resistance transporter